MRDEDKAVILVALFHRIDCRGGAWSFTWNGFDQYSLVSSEATQLPFSWNEQSTRGI
jgi:hypothetical protein